MTGHRNFTTKSNKCFYVARLCVLSLLLASVVFAEEPAPSQPAPPGKTEGGKPVAKGDAVSLFDGKTLQGWKVLDEDSFERHGKVVVEDGAIVIHEGRPASGVCWQGELPRLDYELTLQAKRIAGSDFFCGLTFPVDKDYLTLILGGWGGGVTGLSNLDDMSAVENETTGYVDFKRNTWHKVRLRVTKDKVEAWVDQEQILDTDIADRKLSIWWEQEPARPLGIVTWNTTGAVKDIKLRTL